MISEVTGGEHDPADVREALQHPQAKGVVQKHILAEGIRMTDPNRGNKSVFKTQMSLIGDKGDRAVNESPGAEVMEEDIEPEDAHLVSETAVTTYPNYLTDPRFSFI